MARLKILFGLLIYSGMLALAVVLSLTQPSTAAAVSSGILAVGTLMLLVRIIIWPEKPLLVRSLSVMVNVGIFLPNATQSVAALILIIGLVLALMVVVHGIRAIATKSTGLGGDAVFVSTGLIMYSLAKLRGGCSFGVCPTILDQSLWHSEDFVDAMHRLKVLVTLWVTVLVTITSLRLAVTRNRRLASICCMIFSVFGALFPMSVGIARSASVAGTIIATVPLILEVLAGYSWRWNMWPMECAIFGGCLSILGSVTWTLIYWETIRSSVVLLFCFGIAWLSLLLDPFTSNQSGIFQLAVTIVLPTMLLTLTTAVVLEVSCQNRWLYLPGCS